MKNSYLGVLMGYRWKIIQIKLNCHVEPCLRFRLALVITSNSVPVNQRSHYIFVRSFLCGKMDGGRKCFMDGGWGMYYPIIKRVSQVTGCFYSINVMQCSNICYYRIFDRRKSGASDLRRLLPFFGLFV